MPVGHPNRPEREQLELFRALPGDLAPRDAQDLMAYPFFSLAKTHRRTPIDFRTNDISIRVEAVPEQGMATIWDADVSIRCDPRAAVTLRWMGLWRHPETIDEARIFRPQTVTRFVLNRCAARTVIARETAGPWPITSLRRSPPASASAWPLT